MTTDNPQGGVLRVPGRPGGRRMRKRGGIVTKTEQQV